MFHEKPSESSFQRRLEARKINELDTGFCQCDDCLDVAMNQNNTSLSDKMSRLQANFIEGLAGRVEEAETLFDLLKTNTADLETGQNLQRLFHNIKGVAMTFGFADLGSLAAHGEELMDRLLETPPGEDEAFWQELATCLDQFKSACQSILATPPDAPELPEGNNALSVPASTLTQAVRSKNNQPHVIVVDDDSLMRDVLKALLRSANFLIVGEASNGTDALALCAKVKPDLVLLDINMPRVDGLQVLAEIRREHPTVKVIMVSAQASLDKVSEAIKAGAAGFVVKPFNAAIVLEKIGRCFKGKGTP